MHQVSAYVTAAHIKFLLLHDGRNEEAIKGFFRDVYEAYLRVRAARGGSVDARHLDHACPHVAVAQKSCLQRCCLLTWRVSLQVMMNPFFTPTTRIKSATFQQKVRTASKAYFR